MIAIGSGYTEKFAAVVVRPSVSHSRRGKHMQPVSAEYDDWQRDTVMVVERHLPAITVAKVLEDYFFRIEPALGAIGIAMLSGIFGCTQNRRGYKRCQQRKEYDDSFHLEDGL
jgi:hypothetical protein